MYNLVFDKVALKSLQKLPDNTRKRIWNKLQECKENPFRFLVHLSGINSYKLRVGEYRIIVDVNNSIKILYVLKVGHRKNVYKN